VERLLNGVHDARFRRIDVGGEVVQKVVLGQPRKASFVDVEVCDRRGRRYLFQQASDRLSFVEPEAGDVHESDGVRRIFAKRGHDLPPV
jgi:hypothetical protein